MDEPKWIRTAREQLDRLFSRKMLGSVLIGSSLGKVVEWQLNVRFDGASEMTAAWSAVFVLSVVIFVFWEHLERSAEDAVDAKLETIDELHDKVEEAIDDGEG